SVPGAVPPGSALRSASPAAPERAAFSPVIRSSILLSQKVLPCRRIRPVEVHPVPGPQGLYPLTANAQHPADRRVVRPPLPQPPEIVPLEIRRHGLEFRQLHRAAQPVNPAGTIPSGQLSFVEPVRRQGHLSSPPDPMLRAQGHQLLLQTVILKFRHGTPLFIGLLRHVQSNIRSQSLVYRKFNSLSMPWKRRVQGLGQGRQVGGQGRRGILPGEYASAVLRRKKRLWMEFFLKNEKNILSDPRKRDIMG